MGEVVGCGLLSHVPTIMLPLETRLELNQGQEISLVPGLRRVRAEVLDALGADTIIVFDTHWATTVEFVVTSHERRAGRYTSEELPRGMRQVPYDMKGDPPLAEAIAAEVAALGTPCTANDDPYLPIHYATVNLNHYLDGPERWLSIGVCQTAETPDFLMVGEGIRRAIERMPGRIVLLASGSMSHRFWPLRQLAQHEASDPIHIRTPAARAADLERLDWFAAGDHARVIDTMDAFLAHAPEARFGHYLMMIGAVGGRACRARGRLFSQYENATGTSQVHVWFDRPAGGWTTEPV
jgi:aromatic ring-opening dioxygenase catalytic subunit (LigB family)